MAREGQVLATSRFTRSGGAGAEIADQVADDKVLAEFAAGATLVLQGLHRVWPPVVELGTGLAAQLGHPVQVNAYVTPPQNTGFDPHYDVHDVFVLQFAGRKRWRIHAPVLEAPLRDQPWDARRAAVAEAAAAEPLIDTVLEPGDALYLPRGFLHAATALGEVSGHLTIGVQPLTRALLAEQTLHQLGDDLELRRSLPMGVDLTDPGVLHDELKAMKEALHAAVDRLGAEEVAAAVGRHLAGTTRPRPVSPIAQVAAADALEPGHTVAAREGLPHTLRTREDGRLLLGALSKTITLPAPMADALRVLLAGDPVTVGSLPGLDDQERLVLVRRMLREGLVVPVEEP